MAYRYEPKREIGGDFLFAHPLAFPPSAVETSLTVVLIDVTGHGVSAALAVNRLHGELRRFFAERGEGSEGGPDALLNALNAFTYEHLAPQTIFATALCLRFQAGGAGEGLEWASAGHPPAFLRRPNGTVERLASTATMLGVLDAELFNATACAAAFGEGDVVLAVTDGAVEAQDAAGRELGVDGLERIVRSVRDGREGGHLAAAVMRAVTEHRAGRAVDDTLVVEVKNSQPRP
jgi:serine phosphatase RsbU (regulator of sigma subunit)